MAKKTLEAARTFHVSVLGMSGTEREKGAAGVGKSCLCNRFLRPLADEYYTDHISVLSQSDFGGRVVNNDHFLYWGEVTKTSDEGSDIHFSVVEQTEFIDDASFQPFKGAKTDPYVKRCTATKLTSAEKLMYICKNQLGIEKEYEQKVLPEGRSNVDGFICVFDVSHVPNRPPDRQAEMITAILTGLLRTKKPVVLATTKGDEADEVHVREAERIANRKEFRGSVPLVETSSHENVNVELAFLLLAQMIERDRARGGGGGMGRTKVPSFAEAARARREVLDVATDAYHSLVRSRVTDHRALWNVTARQLANDQDFVHYRELFGNDKAMREFRRHVRRLKDDHVLERKQGYLKTLPAVFHQLLPDLTCIGDSDWSDVRLQLKEHGEFDSHFVECPDELPWEDSDLAESSEQRIPFDLLDSSEAEMVFKNHLNALRAKEKALEMKKQFKHLLEEAGYVTPGKTLPEVKVLFMGRECFEALPEDGCQEIYDLHQKEITDKAKQNFLELLLEHADLFYQLTASGAAGVTSTTGSAGSGSDTTKRNNIQEDILEIVEVLQEDSRYKALDRLNQDRQLILFQHLGFVHCPIREHCPSYPSCMDALIEKVVASKAHRSSTYSQRSSYIVDAESNQLNLVILGHGDLAETLANELRNQCEDDEYELEEVLYTLDYRVISGDVSLPHNSILTSEFLPHGFQQKEPLRGCFCIYSDVEGFEYIRESLEKTLMLNLEQQDRVPFQELPTIILFVAAANLGEKDLIYLRDEGQNLSESIQCPFLDVTNESNSSERRFHDEHLVRGLRSLVELIQHRAAGSLSIYQQQQQQQGAGGEPDIRVIMCLLCGDPYTVEHVLSPLLDHQYSIINSERSILLETYLGDFKRRVEVVVSSYHGANAFREELVHGFVLVYSTKRKASLATLKAFSMNIPNLPIQILAVTDSGGANAFFSSNLSHSLITEGNAIADQLQAHFMTATSTSQQKTAFYTPFFKEVWDKKPEIEQAFNMEEPNQANTICLPGQGTPEKRGHPPSPPHRHESYHVQTGSADGSADSESHYERVPTDGSQGDDMEEPMSPAFADEREPPLSPSDDSDMYYNVYGGENGESLVKPSQLRKRGNLHDETFSFLAAVGTETVAGSVSGGGGGGGGKIGGEEKGPSYATIHHVTMTATYSYTSGTLDHPPPSYRSLTRHLTHTTKTTFPLTMGRQIKGKCGGPRMVPPPCLRPLVPLPPLALRMAATANDDEDEDEGEAEEEDDEFVAGRRAPRGRGFGPDREGFAAYPPPQTPPEPAPPDHPPQRRLKKATTLPPPGSHAAVDDGFFDDTFYPRNHREQWASNDAFRSYTTGRRKVAPPTKPKPGKAQPGKLDLKNFGNVTTAIAKLNINTKEHGGHTGSTPRLTKAGRLHAPLATPESVELGSEYAQVKDVMPMYSRNESEYAYATVHDALQGSRIHRMRPASRRDAGKALTDSDSEWSSLERRPRDSYSKVGRKPGPHKKMRKRRGIPVATPRVPPLPFEGGGMGMGGGGGLGGPAGPGGGRGSLHHHHSHFGKPHPLPPYVGERMMAAHSLEPLEVGSGSPSEGSDGTDGDADHYGGKSVRPKHKFKRPTAGLLSASASSSSSATATASSSQHKKKLLPFPSYLGNSLQHQFGSHLTSDSELFTPVSKFRAEQGEEDSTMEASSPKDSNSPIMFSRKDGDKTDRRKEKQKQKEDEKQEKRRQKEEEKQKKIAEKEKEKLEKKKQKKNVGGTLKGGSGPHSMQMLEEFAQSDDNPVPLFLEKCIRFIEEEGLDSEGIYRVPGNRAHVDLLFQRFEEDPNISIRELDIPVNAVATALKDFFSKRLPPLMSQDATTNLIDNAGWPDRSRRLLGLRKLLKNLPASNFEVLKYVFEHFVRVSENCKLNSMDSKNLAICWWPTLLPIEFNDMGVFERMRPLLEDAVQNMIDQYRFLFCGQEEVVMV